MSPLERSRQCVNLNGNSNNNNDSDHSKNSQVMIHDEEVPSSSSLSLASFKTSTSRRTAARCQATSATESESNRRSSDGGQVKSSSLSVRRRNRSVQFGTDPKVLIQEIDHYREFEPSLREAVWFTTAELDRTIEECRMTVVAMNEEMPLAEDDNDDDPTSCGSGSGRKKKEEFTSRGLEYMTPKGFDITWNSLGIVQKVLEEQRRQREENPHSKELDAEAIASVMNAVSRHRGRIAHLAGMKDARCVYGDGKFKTTIPERTGPQMKSRSFDLKMQRQQDKAARIQRTSSMSGMANIADTRRRLRRVRGGAASTPEERRATRLSAPDAVSGC